MFDFQFEYQQAQLEAEIENLSWKVERADSYDRGVSNKLSSTHFLSFELIFYSDISREIVISNGGKETTTAPFVFLIFLLEIKRIQIQIIDYKR